mmetsp:Transcript_18172/g.59373  ORF Transcript_18172/g.59373 Transcript_18172/m.59373 type:complete len:290 (-) Transcript_18172:1466-2335(-)
MLIRLLGREEAFLARAEGDFGGDARSAAEEGVELGRGGELLDDGLEGFERLLALAGTPEGFDGEGARDRGDGGAFLRPCRARATAFHARHQGVVVQQTLHGPQIFDGIFVIVARGPRRDAEGGGPPSEFGVREAALEQRVRDWAATPAIAAVEGSDGARHATKVEHSLVGRSGSRLEHDGCDVRVALGSVPAPIHESSERQEQRHFRPILLCRRDSHRCHARHSVLPRGVVDDRVCSGVRRRRGEGGVDRQQRVCRIGALLAQLSSREHRGCRRESSRAFESLGGAARA